MEDVSIFKKADMALSKALFHAGKWLLFGFLGIVGVLDIYVTFTDMFSDGWGLSSISKIELAFVVAFLFLSKRVIAAAINSGVNVLKQLFMTMVFLGGLVVFLVVWEYIEVLEALYDGVSAVEVLSFTETMSYEYYFVSMALSLLVLYVSAPFKKNEIPDSGDEYDEAIWMEVEGDDKSHQNEPVS